MKQRIDHKVIQNRWYVSAGNKGYRLPNDIDKALFKWTDRKSFYVTWTSDKTKDSIYKVLVHRKDEKTYILNLYDPNTEESLGSCELCPSAFKDFVIDPTFYINYNPEW